MQRTTGLNQLSQKENNLSLIIRAIHRNDPISRVKLSECTGLKQATISKIVNQLIEWGVVQETESLEGSLGRKPIGLTLKSENFLLMAVRINRDYLYVSIYDISCRMYFFRETKIDAAFGAQASIALLKQMMGEALKAVDLPVMGIGVALPGPFDVSRNRITLMSGFPGWNKIDIRGELQEAFHLPVFMDHDAKCGALAEVWHGKHRMMSEMVYICCDRGVGAGLVLGGQIYHGRTGFAGEIGHMSINLFGPLCECGNRGCLEHYCSTTALEQEYGREALDLAAPIDMDHVTAKDILRMVRDRDPLATRAYTRVVKHLALGAVNVVNALNPQAIIFADKIIEGGDVFIETVRDVMKSYLLEDIYNNLVIDTSTVEGDPMLLGASVLVFEELLSRPSIYFGGQSGAIAE